MQFGWPRTVQLTSTAGQQTLVEPVEGDAERDDGLEVADAGGEEPRAEGDTAGRDHSMWRLAAVARKELPEMVMTAEELERACVETPKGKLRITPIWIRPCAARLGVNRVANGAAPPGDADGEAKAHLPGEEGEEAAATLARLTKEFADVFPAELPAGLPPLRGVEGVHIPTGENARPIGRYGPRMSAEDTEAAGKIIEELLAKGFIRPSRSPWGSPMFLVAKPDGTRRMVIDYRALNSSTIR
ncbi:MAG: hypothetical protein P4L30_10355, partial [Candidatus Limnocylindrales bacterium]|nr:hypothetical protein [Candidatus Limnocylindrales bacterium]